MASPKEAALMQQVASLEQELSKEMKEAAKERKVAANAKKQVQAMAQDLAKAKALREHYRRQSEDVVESTVGLPKPLPASLLARFKELYEQAAPDKPAGLTLEPAQAGALTGILLHFLRIDGEAEVVGPLESVEEVSCACFVLGEGYPICFRFTHRHIISSVNNLLISLACFSLR